MNIYGIIILSTIFLELSLDIIADYLNIKSSKKEIPQEYEGVYDLDNYIKSQEYLRINTRFSQIEGVAGLIITLIFWFGHGFNTLDLSIRNLNLNPIWTGLIYISSLLLFRTILSLPFNIYQVFVIEERFGFNRTTPSTFIKDMLKGLILAIILGGPSLAGILIFFQYTGKPAWFYGWMVSSIFILFVQFIAPRWILPWFNKFEPLAEGSLKEAIMTYAERAGFPLKNIFVMDGSKRSTKSNAFFTGYGQNRRIALFDTLIKQHSTQEIIAILAHEIGHYKKQHTIIQMVMSIIHMGLMFFLFSLFISEKGLFDAFYMDYISVYAGLIFFGLLYSPIEFILSIFIGILSRKFEYAADRFAAETTMTPQDLINALKKMSSHHLSNLTPHPLYVFFNYSHPPDIDRIKALRTISIKS